MDYGKIKKQEEFSKIFSKGKRIYSSTLTLLYIPAKKTSMGISVGKKHGKAFMRNRIKRLIREAFRNIYPKIRGKYNIIFLPKVMDNYELSTFIMDMKKMIEKEKL